MGRFENGRKKKVDASFMSGREERKITRDTLAFPVIGNLIRSLIRGHLWDSRTKLH